MIANEQFAPDRYERALAAIHRLIAEQSSAATPSSTRSARASCSRTARRRCLATSSTTRHVYTFWTDWDAEHGRAVFTTWEQIEPEPALARSRSTWTRGPRSGYRRCQVNRTTRVSICRTASRTSCRRNSPPPRGPSACSSLSCSVLVGSSSSFGGSCHDPGR